MVSKIIRKWSWSYVNISKRYDCHTHCFDEWMSIPRFLQPYRFRVRWSVLNMPRNIYATLFIVYMYIAWVAGRYVNEKRAPQLASRCARDREWVKCGVRSTSERNQRLWKFKYLKGNFLRVLIQIKKNSKKKNEKKKKNEQNKFSWHAS